MKRKGKLCVYRDKANEWRWNFKASNGRILADSGEGYKRRRDCEHGASLVLYSVPFNKEVRQ